MRWARFAIGEAFPDWAPQPGPRPEFWRAGRVSALI
jgi:hypothetical protein